MKTDSLFYRLFQSSPILFFELINQFPGQAERYIFRSVELKQAFRIDGVFRPPSEATNSGVYFVEVQFQRDEQLYRRLFAEAFLFLKQNPEITDWQSVAIYPNRSIVRSHEFVKILIQSLRFYLNLLIATVILVILRVTPTQMNLPEKFSSCP